MLISILARIVVGILLLVHGVAHYTLPTVWGSRPTPQSWLLGNVNEASLRSISSTLWITTLVLFMAAGLLTFFNLPFWRVLAIAGSIFSLLTILLFWDNKMILGVAVNVGVLVALLWFKWPPSSILH